MRNLARNDARSPEIRSLAIALQNPWGLDVWLRESWTITPDPVDVEYVRAPNFALQCGMEGDCDDAATLAASILLAMRWPAVFIATRQATETDFSHVFVRVLGINLDIDPIVPEQYLPIRFAESMTVPL
jgi:transglutaminase-like putative cysteine protease